MNTQAPSILIVDDDIELSAMVCEYLVNEGFSVTVANEGHDGLIRALNDSPDGIILDVMLPGISGIEILRRIRETSTVPVLMLTAKGDQVDRVVGLELGADDYITKPYFPRELVARLRAVLRRGSTRPRTPERHRWSDLELDEATREVRWGKQKFDLTATEFSMLRELLRAGSRVSTKNDLSLSVLGRKREAYDRSVDVHVSNLRLKLHAATGNRLTIETSRGVGYRMLAVPDGGTS